METNSPHGPVVLVDDDASVLSLQHDALQGASIANVRFSDPVDAWRYVQSQPCGLVVTDWEMPGLSGMDLLFKIRGLPRPPHVIVLTGYGTVGRAVHAMSHGAFTFLEKPFNIARYVETVRQALTAAATVPASATESPGMHAPVVQSEPLRRVFDMARTAAATDSTILLLGESGTGKEVLTDHIHRHSPRHKGPLVKVNCGALPEHLMESELFGHEKGAFTGADRRRIGRFEQAHNGTLFLDEIGDLLLPLQVKLLRALQERTIERVGGNQSVPVDLRLVCATHRDLREAVRRGEFREDLYYRINVVPIRVPALRDRVDDIEPLARQFLRELRERSGSGPRDFSADALEALRLFDWPGNVRQLRNAIEYAVVLCRGETVQAADLPDEVQEQHVKRSSPHLFAVDDEDKNAPRSLEEHVSTAESRAILTALERHHWRINDVLRDLQVSRSRLYERMKLYGIRRK